MTASELKIGTPVTCYSVILDSGKKLNPFDTIVASKVWTIGVGGEEVVKVIGKTGGVAISHLFPRKS